MRKPRVVCNHTYHCPLRKECGHAKPHVGKGAGCDGMIGGAWAICQDAKISSICVPVIRGRYLTESSDHCVCPTCGDHHSHDKKVWHKVRKA